MDYMKHYYLLCERGRVKRHGMYLERHHIIPKCKGGSNSEDNLTWLTAKEHYIAHYLLHMSDQLDRQLWYALFCMAFMVNEHQHRYHIGSRVYQRLKEERSEDQKRNVHISLKNLEKAVAAVKGKKRPKEWNENATKAWIKKKGKGSALTREEMVELMDKYEWSVYAVQKGIGWSIPTVLRGLSYHNIPYEKKKIGQKNKRPENL